MVKYFPIIKTTDAELKGYFFLDSFVKKGLIPVFELTRSRRSKNNSNGDVEIKMKKIFDLCEGRKFILDVTTENTLSNSQTTAFLDNANGFINWTDFIKKHQDGSIIPCVHYMPGEEKDIETQLKNLESISDVTACRFGFSDDEGFNADEVENAVKFLLGKRIKPIYIIVDSGFVHLKTLDLQKNKILELAKKLNPILGKNDVVFFPSSSFPKSVMDSGYGKANAESGGFKIGEVEIFKELKKISKKIPYSDFGSIHPKRYEDFGKWTPRIDYPVDNEFFFYRYKLEAGGYVTAAKAIVKDKFYNPIKKIQTWGDEEVIAAAAGNPNGKSPSHWIAVRMNLHITRQFLNL
ncbi:hypothetical protein EHQ23_19535 [Leptospira bourretii]|uniref:Beta protein n=1 Tax=Leptospira bourretii TaxID=2484962 RepID=A0A4R9ISC0_9LEPT|nr:MULTISPECIES: beta family protein [Leptospira]TGK79249.1 hypothetical protein EHQ23_19535 [Leptospira bourretii]TGK94362.1 hypothetical protein EHQ26_03240 [Leptospira bourretii]TGL16785.1 hypothetical protein EHQ42_10650 [Leptospira levettii]TGL38817.1 hypothetical protein EHQ45_04405 [Leptospira bourretii]